MWIAMFQISTTDYFNLVEKVGVSGAFAIVFLLMWWRDQKTTRGVLERMLQIVDSNTKMLGALESRLDRLDDTVEDLRSAKMCPYPAAPLPPIHHRPRP